jgi:acyl-coenzyme A thioesterase PaaI-like protein
MNCVMSARPLVARSTRTGVQCFSSALFGGRDEQSFRQICEGSSKFVKDVLSPKIVSLSPGSLTMVLPFKQDFIGNPLIPCLHGGIAASMLDHAASSCATAALEDTKLYVVTSGESCT